MDLNDRPGSEIGMAAAPSGLSIAPSRAREKIRMSVRCPFRVLTMFHPTSGEPTGNLRVGFPVPLLEAESWDGGGAASGMTYDDHARLMGISDFGCSSTFLRIRSR